MPKAVLIPIIIVAALLVAAAAWLGIGYGVTRASGPVVSEGRDVAAFTKVEVSGRGTLVITKGETTHLEIEAQQSVLDRLETTVSGDTLRIESRLHLFDLGIFWGTEPITYHLTVPALTAVKLSGAITVRGESPLAADQFVLECSGSSEVSLEVQTGDLRVETSGSSDITLTGQADTVSFEGSGSTTILARHLVSRVATVDCSGSSRLEVNASERLSVDASGSSTVSHVGSPVLSTNISGSGEVRQLSE